MINWNDSNLNNNYCKNLVDSIGFNNKVSYNSVDGLGFVFIFVIGGKIRIVGFSEILNFLEFCTDEQPKMALQLYKLISNIITR